MFPSQLSLIFFFATRIDSIVVINEINTDNPSKPESSEYVELKFIDPAIYDQTSPAADTFHSTMECHYLLLFKPYSNWIRGPTVLTFVDLHHERFSKGPYFLIGKNSTNDGMDRMEFKTNFVCSKTWSPKSKRPNEI